MATDTKDYEYKGPHYGEPVPGWGEICDLNGDNQHPATADDVAGQPLFIGDNVMVRRKENGGRLIRHVITTSADPEQGDGEYGHLGEGHMSSHDEDMPYTWSDVWVRPHLQADPYAEVLPAKPVCVRSDKIVKVPKMFEDASYEHSLWPNYLADKSGN